MKLFNYWRSSSSYRVRLALHFKGLPFEYVSVALNTGEQSGPAHQERNPFGTVPLLEVEHAGKTLRIPQSVAIVEFLEEKYTDKPLFPTELGARAAMRAMVEQVNSGIQPFQNLATTKYVKDELKADDKKFAAHMIHTGLGALERFTTQTAGRFMVGDDFTWADCCLLPQLFGARRFNVPVSDFPLLSRLEATALALDFVQRSVPERQIDAQIT